MSEQAFWELIDKNVGHKGHFSRIESPEIGAGIPDVDYCVDGVEGKMELKYGFEKVPEIRPTQYRWIKKRVEHGGRVWIFVHISLCDKNRYWLFKGEKVEKLVRAKILMEWMEIADYIWEDRPDWASLLRIITRKSSP